MGWPSAAVESIRRGRGHHVHHGLDFSSQIIANIKMAVLKETATPPIAP